jgi:hypothetical protein
MSHLYFSGHQAMAISQDERVSFVAMGERITALPKAQKKFVMQELDSVISSSGTMNTQH